MALKLRDPLFMFRSPDFVQAPAITQLYCRAWKIKNLRAGFFCVRKIGYVYARAQSVYVIVVFMHLTFHIGLYLLIFTTCSIILFANL